SIREQGCFEICQMLDERPGMLLTIGIAQAMFHHPGIGDQLGEHVLRRGLVRAQRDPLERSISGLVPAVPDLRLPRDPNSARCVLGDSLSIGRSVFPVRELVGHDHWLVETGHCNYSFLKSPKKRLLAPNWQHRVANESFFLSAKYKHLVTYLVKR